MKNHSTHTDYSRPIDIRDISMAFLIDVKGLSIPYNKSLLEKKQKTY